MSERLKTAKSPRLDLQDGLVCIGFASLEAGVAMVYRPASLILGGLMLLFFALLIERSKRAGSK